MNIRKLLALVLIVIATGLFAGWSGAFNVAANDKHWAITSTFLEWVRDRSISTRAQEITVPELGDSARIKRGAANYAAMCAQCHLAPGVDTSELHEGLNPQPPILYKDADFAEKPAETFWVVKNGIKMTGMPAWGVYNSDEQIWDMIATIKAMDKMTAEQYQQLVSAGEHTHKGGGHGDMGGHSEAAGHSPMGDGEQAAGHDTTDHHHGTATEGHHGTVTDHHHVKPESSDHYSDGHTH